MGVKVVGAWLGDAVVALVVVVVVVVVVDEDEDEVVVEEDEVEVEVDDDVDAEVSGDVGMVTVTTEVSTTVLVPGPDGVEEDVEAVVEEDVEAVVEEDVDAVVDEDEAAVDDDVAALEDAEVSGGGVVVEAVVPVDTDVSASVAIDIIMPARLSNELPRSSPINLASYTRKYSSDK